MKLHSLSDCRTAKAMLFAALFLFTIRGGGLAGDLADGADPMDKKASQLAAALGIPKNIKTSEENGAAVFDSETTTLELGAFQASLKHRSVQKTPPATLLKIDILDKNGKVVATGDIMRGESFSAVCETLLRKLVTNSMSILTLTRKYDARRGDIGDVCVFEKYPSSKAITTLHFIRGRVAVSLRPTNSAATDIRAIAKALDAILSKKK